MAKRRTRSPHPGVVLIPPDEAGRHPTWRARFADPDTGKVKKVRLDPLVLSTAEARRQWAIRKSKQLTRRKLELEATATGATLEAVVVQRALRRLALDNNWARDWALDNHEDISSTRAPRERRVQRKEPPVRPSASLRYQILSRDKFRCVACGRGADQVELHVDHIIPVSRGGRATPDNLRTLCAEDNLGKGSREA